METSILELKTIIQGFRLSCQTEGKSPKTIEWYYSFLHRFRQFLISSNFPTDIHRISKDHIRAFILYLQTKAQRQQRDPPRDAG